MTSRLSVFEFLRNSGAARLLYRILTFLQASVLMTPWILRTRQLDNFSDFQKMGRTPRNTYIAFLAKFHFWLPANLKAHRSYFSREGRGFGEDAFHAMWTSLFAEYKFKDCLEIGVYRGQTLALWSLLQKDLGINGEIIGCTPLSEIGDEYSTYSQLDYRADIITNCDAVGAKHPTLIPFASQTAEAMRSLGDKTFDLIYIDGSHDFADVMDDIRLAKRILRPGGVLVLDDAALFRGYKPFFGSFAGHPGPSKAAISEEVSALTNIGGCGHNIVFEVPKH